MDYSHFSTDDLKALKSGDYSKLSTAALSYISHNRPETGPDLGALQREDKPIQDISATEAIDAPFKAAQAAGEFGSQAAAQRGMNPQLAAALGTGVAMLPHAAMAAQVPVKALGQAAEGGLSAIGNKIGGIVNTLKAPTAEEAKVLNEAASLSFNPNETAQKAAQYNAEQMKPLQENIRQIGQRMTTRPVEADEKLFQLQSMLSEAGKKMGTEEVAGKFGFQSTSEFEQALKDPKVAAKVFKVAEKFANQAPEDIAATVDPQTIQTTRKYIEQSQPDVSRLGNVTLQRGRENAAKALGLINKKFGAAREEYQALADKIAQFPDTEKKAAQMLKSQLFDAKSKLADAKEEAKALMTSAKTADGEALKGLQSKMADLLRRSVEHDQLVRKITATATAIGTAGLGAIGIKKYKGY